MCLGLYFGIEGCRPYRVYIGKVPVRYVLVHRKAYGPVVKFYYCISLQDDVFGGRIAGC